MYNQICYISFLIGLLFLVNITNVDGQTGITGGATFGEELTNLDFSGMLGAPFIAAIDAQSQAARVTMDFITELGFTYNENGDKTVLMVDYLYEKVNNETGTLQNYTITLPFLTMLPIPYLEVTLMTIDFK
jgi:hypothetical protein